MADPVTMAIVASTALSATTTLMGGAAAAAQGKAQQQQANMRAKEELATGQREAREEERRKELAQSALVARAGASGSGVSDPTVGRLFEGIEQEGLYNQQAALASRQNQAASTRYQGALAKWAGKTEQRASYFDAAGTLIGGFTKTPMAKRYSTPGGDDGDGGKSGY